ncbi:penicillin-binding protein 1A [Sporanaerobacter acetigenes]|uniref:Penicillin-binding protein 1A n=1 Tax=Sporanaerobacter acetigenes DSM 13106 TaxID=1123281 RepID=A0A1M5UM13_9FIRM|nr:PBP1A family penicillin-binding protein [Sporanaerobacter acetigenes]SHH63926.1 penicillin-binding protein 1A [Sporanaerobacter acetigenes DSM 13106]
MSEDNTRKQESEKKKKKKKKKNGLKIFLLILLMILVVGIGAVTGMVIAIAKDAPQIDPTNIGSLLSQTSFILDENGNTIEKVQTEEYRTIVSLEKMPPHLQNAFISIEDERFRKHIGVDPKGIMSAVFDNIKAGATVRGASTITQQLARNLYLNNDKKLDRKIKEAYLAMQMEKALTKDQILEAYLNRIDLGQGAFGVQEAAQTYFSKNVDELTIAESALLAGIVKSPSKYSPYFTVRPEDFNGDTQEEIGQVDKFGEKFIVISNSNAIKRQHVVLGKMKELGYITDKEYNEAINEDIKTILKPGQKKINGISSYFTDYVKVQAIEAMMGKLGYTREQAEKELYTGGLKIYSTMDVNMQHKIEDIYTNFTEILFGNPQKLKGPVLIDWSLDKNKNIVDERKKIIYYRQENLFDENFNLVIEKGTFEIRDGNIAINNKKITPYKNNIDIGDYYAIDDKKNLVTHSVGSLTLPEDGFRMEENGEVLILNTFLSQKEDFHRIDENGNLIINSNYFYRSKDGIVQPQSATVIMDYRTGAIKALVGGRDIKGNKLLNRATSSQRQPGSSIKPIAVYLPALDNGFTAASIIDDIPHYNENGELWPKNWYSGYRGLTTLRNSVEQSINVNSVKVLESIGINTSLEYLKRLGIINEEHPEKDNFISRAENKANNDENLAALGLGGMTKGLTPLEMTAAYGAIANSGTYTEPITFTKILDKDGNVLIENNPKQNMVVSPEIAYIMSDILRTTVANGIAGRAQIPKMPTAGKTGTTQENADAWFVGFTPYYVSAVWIGNDSPTIKLTKGSAMAAELWKNIMIKVHENLEPQNFEMPPNIVKVSICSQSGKLPSEICSRDPRGNTIISEIFAKGTEPREHCNTHVVLDIDTTTGKIANEYCPKELIQSKVFIKREPPYNPADHNGIMPKDYQYTAPWEICPVHNQENAIDEWIDEQFNEENNGEEEPPIEENPENDVENPNNGNGNNQNDQTPGNNGNDNGNGN